MALWKKIAIGVVAFLVVLGIGGYVAITLLSKPLPQGKQGAEAEAYAQKMLEAINQPAWDSTYAVRWNFAGLHDHLWDRKRNYAQVNWDKYRVQLDIDRKEGIVWYKGKPLNREEDRHEKVMMAWRFWVNDSFWLNPVGKVIDPGTERHLIDLENGKKGLLVTYTQGGDTPGDSYLWLTDENHLPTEWKLWVSIVPLKGASFTWEDWQPVSTGAKIATLHQGMVDIKISNLKTFGSLEELSSNGDPFGPLEDYLRSN